MGTNGHTQRVAMYMLHMDHRSEAAREALAEQLPGATVDAPDDTGVFEIAIDADDQEAALSRVWDAMAAAGVDDRIAFMEHPELPEHWRARAGRPSGST
jgi:hypothetical protein